MYQWCVYTIIRNQLTVYPGHHIPPVTYVQQVSVSGEDMWLVGTGEELEVRDCDSAGTCTVEGGTCTSV